MHIRRDIPVRVFACWAMLLIGSVPLPARALVAWQAGATWATNMQAFGVTGTSIRIGIVETDIDAGANYVYRINPSHTNGGRTGFFDGKVIAYHDSGEAIYTNYSWHAGDVALYAVGNYSSVWGVANARGFAPGCTNIDNYAADFFINACMASNLALGEQIYCFAFTTTTSTQQRLTADVDRMVDTQNKVFVQGVRPRPATEASGGDHPAGMGVAFNSIAVAACESGYTNHGNSQFGPSHVFGTAKPELLAGHISESEATARAAGGAVFLMDQAAKNGWPNGQDARVIKAIMLAGARKTVGWDKGEDGVGDDHAVPLDYNAGAGILHCVRNYGIMFGGEMPVGSTNARAAWDLGSVDPNRTNLYFALVPQTNIYLSAVLAWNRHVGATTNLQDLDLKLYSVSNGLLDTLVDWSTSRVDSVEHVYWLASSTGLYALAVDGGGLAASELYGIAFGFAGTTDTPLYDEDADGVGDAFERAHFGEIYLYGATDDPDSDRVDNYEEYMADTVPTNSTSVFTLDILSDTNQAIVVTFNSSTGRKYKVEYSADFLTTNPCTWAEATTNWWPGSGSETNWVDDGSGTGGHPSETTGRVYRAKVTLR